MRYRTRLFILAAASAGLLIPPHNAALADQLVVAAAGTLSSVPLPLGTVTPQLSTVAKTVRELAYFDDGRLMALRDVVNGQGEAVGVALARIENDGTVVDVGLLEPADDAAFGEIHTDLVTDSQGRLFVLSHVSVWWNPPDGYSRLAEVNPEDGTTVSSFRLSDYVGWLARSPDGLWAATFDGLHRLDPDTGILTFHRSMAMAANDGDSDSSGALWLYSEGICSPPCFLYQRFDPATGDVRNVQEPNPGLVVVHDLTVRRTCQESPSDLCLQGGRFKVEVAWRDSDQVEGTGFTSQARSADSGIFWFFNAANWELMVKVLNGCDLGGHFWVFASGSTNVEYTLTVTDLETNAVQRYDNPLGQTAMTVTDTAAFACQL